LVRGPKTGFHRYNAEGVAGLSSRCSPGRPPALNEAQLSELRCMVLEGPDVERHKVVPWHRCAVVGYADQGYGR
jgi:transposase